MGRRSWDAKRPVEEEGSKRRRRIGVRGGPVEGGQEEGGKTTKKTGKLDSRSTVTRLNLGCLILVPFLIKSLVKSHLLTKVSPQCMAWLLLLFAWRQPPESSS